jgi:hypothetical protein
VAGKKLTTGEHGQLRSKGIGGNGTINQGIKGKIKERKKMIGWK